MFSGNMLARTKISKRIATYCNKLLIHRNNKCVTDKNILWCGACLSTQKLVKSNKIMIFNQSLSMSSGHCSSEYKHNTTTTPPYVILSIRPPPKLYTHLSIALLFRLICHTPITKRGLSVHSWPFPTVLMMKNIKKNRRGHVPFMLLAAILPQWRRPVASSETLDLLHWAIHAILYRHTAAANQNGQLCKCICWLLFVCLLPWQL